MRYPVLILVIISAAGMIAAIVALAFGHSVFAALILAVTFIIARVVLQRQTQYLQRRPPPPKA